MSSKFIEKYEFGSGTHRLDGNFESGCYCRSDNNRQMKCEYLYYDYLENTAKTKIGNPRGLPYHVTVPQGSL